LRGPNESAARMRLAPELGRGCLFQPDGANQLWHWQ
jgi:hypothetical protein